MFGGVVSSIGTALAHNRPLRRHVEIICDQATNVFLHILAGGLQEYVATSSERDPTLPICRPPQRAE